MERSRRCDTKEMPRKGAEKKKKNRRCLCGEKGCIHIWMDGMGETLAWRPDPEQCPLAHDS